MLSLLEASAALQKKEVSSRELTEASLAAIATSELNAFITVLGDSALEAARRADQALARGEWLGPLHGIPVAVKDLFCTAGVRTTSGSRIFADYVPSYDAAVVERLAAAGAVLVGKTNMHELAYGITSENPHYGTVRNPYDPTRIPGGSSGGSGAAVAAGLVFASPGSDTGGSIRIPASYCGCVGLKPTYGRISRYGMLPLGFSLDHAGPIARTVRDAATLLNVLAGPDPRDRACSRRPAEDYLPEAPIRGRRIGIPENFFFDGASPEVRTAVEKAARAAEALGAIIIPVRLPDIAEINSIGRLILLAEASAILERHLDGDFGSDVRALLEQGLTVRAVDYVNAQRLRRVHQRAFRKVFDQVDCLFTPTTAITAPRIGERTVGGEDVRLASTCLVRPFNVTGFPALSMPCGRDSAGLPIGLQVVGPPFAEKAVLEVAQAMESALA